MHKQLQIHLRQNKSQHTLTSFSLNALTTTNTATAKQKSMYIFFQTNLTTGKFDNDKYYAVILGRVT